MSALEFALTSALGAKLLGELSIFDGIEIELPLGSLTELDPLILIDEF
jgi:hypothetical protein